MTRLQKIPGTFSLLLLRRLSQLNRPLRQSPIHPRKGTLQSVNQSDLQTLTGHGRRSLTLARGAAGAARREFGVRCSETADYQEPGGKGLWGPVAARLLGRRGAQGLRPGAQRRSSSFSSRLFERSARRARSEFRDGPQDRAPQGSRRVQRPTAPVKRCNRPPQAFAAPRKNRSARHATAMACRL